MSKPSQKTILDVGNCAPDHAAIAAMFRRHFGARVLSADDGPSALDALHAESIDLVTVNRKLDCDYSDGLEVIKLIRRDQRWNDIPVMLVTNYPEHQQQAVAAGGVLGFGKLSLDQPTTLENLRRYLQ